MESGLRSTVEALEAEAGTSPEAEERARWARVLEHSLREQKQRLREIPALEGQLNTDDPEAARAFVKSNQGAILGWLGKLETSAAETRGVIWKISKDSFEAKNHDTVTRNSALLAFGLSMQRKISEEVVRQATPLMLALHAEKIRDDADVVALRDAAMKNFLGHVGATVVAENDVKTLLSTLSAYRSEGKIPAPIADALDTAARTQKAGLAHAAKNNALSQLNREEKSKLDSELSSFRKSLSGASYLYRPGQNRYAVLNFLIIIGNLTWGSVNTLIGAGIVVAAMVASPFTPYVRFPGFALAGNGKQIYVDVSGMSPIAGKMSLGLFELDNRAGWTFATHHEGVHALQSALMGPFYIPVVLASYLVAGFDEGFMEDWADAWAPYI